MRILVAAAALTIGLAGCGHQARSAPGTDHAVANTGNHVVATPADPDPRVGAIFLSGSDLHACTGSVLHSTAGNLVLTAAHCLSAGGPVSFVPGFARVAPPDDVWTVDALYLDPRWLANKDPSADFAIARVGRPAGGSIEGVVGSALSLGSAPAHGTQVSVIAYPAGVGGLPVGCQVAIGLNTDGFPELPCAGLVDGTSGAPWISGSAVVGVIGGLHGGGCAQNLSYSSPFDQHVTDLLVRAEAGGAGDTPPGAYDDEC
jgi:Trypsin